MINICQNPKCNNPIIGKRSDAKHCSSYCQKRNKQIRNKKHIKEYLRIYRIKYYDDNKEKIALRQKNNYNSDAKKEYYSENKQHILNNAKIYRKNNRKLRNSYEAKRRATKLKATPKWADLEIIKEFYKNCPKGYHVDHIYPLISDVVCGLHVIENLQYLTASENCSKKNRVPVTAR